MLPNALIFTIYALGAGMTFWVGKMAVRNLFVIDNDDELLESIMFLVIAGVSSWFGIVILFIAWLIVKIGRSF